MICKGFLNWFVVMISNFDPSLKRKEALVTSTIQQVEGKGLLPAVVEISESGTCNRVCDFCPRSNPDFHHDKTFINPNLVSKVATELAEFSYTGIILFSGFVEPLLDKKLENHIQVFKSACPSAQVEIVTNGDALSVTRIKKLFAAGLGFINVSAYDGPDQVLEFNELFRLAEVNPENYVIKNRFYKDDGSIDIFFSNRAGELEREEYQIKPLDKALDRPCYYPSYTFFFDYLGDVLICPHDWGKKLKVGNLYDASIADIWFGSKMSRARRSLGRGDRGISPCRVCDVDGTKVGKDHFNLFQ